MRQNSSKRRRSAATGSTIVPENQFVWHEQLSPNNQSITSLFTRRLSYEPITDYDDYGRIVILVTTAVISTVSAATTLLGCPPAARPPASQLPARRLAACPPVYFVSSLDFSLLSVFGNCVFKNLNIFYAFDLNPHTAAQIRASET